MVDTLIRLYFIGFLLSALFVWIGEEGNWKYRTYQAVKYGLGSWYFIFCLVVTGLFVMVYKTSEFIRNIKRLNDIDNYLRYKLNKNYKVK